MKKLIMMLAVAAVAVVANASQVKWGFSQTINASSPSTAAKMDGYSAYLVLQSGWDPAAGTYAQLAAAALDSSALTVGGNGSTIFNYKVAQTTKTGLTIDSSEIDANKLAKFYVVVVDSSNSKFYSYAGTASVLDDGSIATATAIFPSVTGASAIDASDFKSFAGGPGPVPEPTSGLLLLLGIAGVALKRKRA